MKARLCYDRMLDAWCVYCPHCPRIFCSFHLHASLGDACDTVRRHLAQHQEA